MSQPPTGDQHQIPDFAAPGYQPEPPVGVHPAPAYPDHPVSPVTATPGPVGGQPVENVGRGVLFSLAAIPLGTALTVGVWQLGFVASITTFALAAAAVWLYAKGAGSAPAKGALAVIGVIVVGVVASIVGVIASDAVRYLGEEYPGTAVSDQVAFVLANLADGEVWQSYGGDIAMFVLFAALGTFGVIRQLGRAKAV
ncbi:MAG: hypothetical protein IT193_05545 [Propionibacteriaceae bacterium]|nr:hypothetical protein [Propionibacteriaceae bacterium]